MVGWTNKQNRHDLIVTSMDVKLMYNLAKTRRSKTFDQSHLTIVVYSQTAWESYWNRLDKSVDSKQHGQFSSVKLICHIEYGS